MGGFEIFPWAVAAAAVAAMVYPLPGWIAFRGSHEKRGAILALNLLLGWTLFGWVAALAWATARPDRNVPEFLLGPARVEPTLGHPAQSH